MEAVVSNIRKAQAATGESVNICTLNCKKIKLICYRCDSSHCALCTAQCHEYGRVGHIKKICHSKKTPRGWGRFKYNRIEVASLLSHKQDRARTPNLLELFRM